MNVEGTAGETSLFCNHGCETEILDQGHIVSKFIDTFFDVLLMHERILMHERNGEWKIDACSGAMLQALRATYDAEEEVWLYERLRKVVIQVLIKMGTNAVLSNKNIMIQIALTIIHLENFHKEDKLRFGVMRQKVYVKLNKIANGGERELLRFYNKRMTCTCLSERYAMAKSTQAKVGVCSVCKKTVDRSVLMTCSLCQFGDYCSRSCQVNDWPSHKGCCELTRSDKGVVVTFYDP